MTDNPFLTQEQYDFIYTKYYKLFHKIYSNISGDFSISQEDITQEMMLVANKVVQNFKHKFPGKDFNDYKDSSMFDKFIKTSFWNAKNTIGKKISNKKNVITNHLEDIPKDDFNKVTYKPSYSFSAYENYEVLEKLKKSDFNELITLILNNPDVVENSGKINVSRLALLSSKSIYLISKELQELHRIYGNFV